MPSYRFTGLVETMYPETRDAAGRPLGAVEPGDVRDLDEPLDWQWEPAGDSQPPASDPAPAPASEPESAPAVPEPAADAPVPDGPQPAPPAVVPPGPQPFAVTTGT